MLQAYINHERGNQAFRGRQHIAPLKGGFFQPLKVNGNALTTDCLAHFPIMDLDTTHLRFELLRIDKQGVSCLDLPGNCCTGNHRSESLHSKNPIHCQTEISTARSGFHRITQTLQMI